MNAYKVQLETYNRIICITAKDIEGAAKKAKEHGEPVKIELIGECFS